MIVKRILRFLLWVLVLGTLEFYSQQKSFAQGATVPTPNFDPETLALINHAEHVIFLIPFSHWDTDWHDTFAKYSQLADRNILKAIQLAKQYPRFRYTLEQVVFVQHFWDNHPEAHDDLLSLVRNRQITFAWGGITQPETSLVAPSIQLHNLILGRDWIAQTFGPEFVPRTAWQSDAFGNSAALANFLAQAGVPYLYIGRWQGGCDPDYQKCKPHPPAFYWTSPSVTPELAGRILVTYISYATAWADIYHRTDPDAQLTEIRNSADTEFKLTGSKYLFMPVGFDFEDPQANLLDLVDRWNAADQHTALVLADPDSAFQYLATETLPELNVDFNPIWQAFYDTRPDAKIADKETEYYLTAADKLGALVGSSAGESWNLAAVNAHYDNVAGVSFDSVWNDSQHPRFNAAISAAQNTLARTVGGIANRAPGAVTIFNPTSWSRSEILEVTGDIPGAESLPQPVQRISPTDVVFRAQNVPPLGYSSLQGEPTAILHPAAAIVSGNRVTLTNGLVTVAVDGDHGGVLSSLSLASSNGQYQELLNGSGDDVTYWDDKGDVYGAFFGQEHARESQVSAQLKLLANGPLLARVQASFTLGGQPVIKTITLKADDPLISVDLDIIVLDNTTAIAETSTILDTNTRTDDLGFGAFNHTVDPRPITSGDVTYRRAIFYPIMYWSDVSTGGVGLTLITHGLQGVGGTATRSIMLVRQVTSRDEGLTDPGVHHLSYAYLPHVGTVTEARPWLAAYAFNQPLIVAWKAADHVNIRLPFDSTPVLQFTGSSSQAALPGSFSLMSQSFASPDAVLADIAHQGDHNEALVINYAPTASATLALKGQNLAVPKGVVSLLPLGNFPQANGTQ